MYGSLTISQLRGGCVTLYKRHSKGSIRELWKETKAIKQGFLLSR